MNQHPNISKGIISCVSKIWQNKEFQDFQVTVGGEHYSCHSFILASCSEFFGGLLRSNMKERKEMKAEICNISAPTFQVVLDSLYSGCDLLTKENVLDVWSAVHQLQIQFMIEHCEDFAVDNLSVDTVETYKEHAEYLQSEKVCGHVFDFILKNFETLREKEMFLRLNFPYLRKLFESDRLKVNSEDLVLCSIFDWVNYGTRIIKSKNASTNNTHGLASQNIEIPNKEDSSLKGNIDSITEEQLTDSIFHRDEPNERKQFLIPLLKSTRYYLASEACVLRLYKDKLILSDNLVKECLLEAFAFKFCDYAHDYWPAAAIHRKCSKLEHVGVICEKGTIKAISFKRDKRFCIADFPGQLNARLTVFNGKLYGSSLGNAINELYVLQTNKWNKVTDISHAVQLLLTHGKYMYAFDYAAKQITRFNPETSPITLERFVNEIENPAYAISFQSTIVVFSSVNNKGVEETAVHSWNTETQVWTKLDNLKFSAQNMISFRDDKNTYILECHGNLWKLTHSGSIGFAFVAKLWNEKRNIKGAALFRQTLFTFDDTPELIGVLKEVDGVYSSSIEWEVDETSSTVTPFVIPRSELNPIKSKSA